MYAKILGSLIKYIAIKCDLVYPLIYLLQGCETCTGNYFPSDWKLGCVELEVCGRITPQWATFSPGNTGPSAVSPSVQLEPITHEKVDLIENGILVSRFYLTACFTKNFTVFNSYDCQI